MEVGNILHMNTGDGELSYAKNSSLQENAIQKASPILKQVIKDLANDQQEVDAFRIKCFKIAELGCSSSQNALLVVSNIIDTVIEVCEESKCKPPQFEVCLNDLFGNDFNSLIKLLPEFYAKLKKEKGENYRSCFVSVVPGSFYGRLFPNQSLHLVHSSYSNHWLSQVPEGLGNNTSNIYMSKTSPPNVFQAYGNQFLTDFTRFLQMRSQEIVRGGRMVLTIVGRSLADPTNDDSCCIWKLLAQSLMDMAKEGLVQESDINSFNVPIYYPCQGEVMNIIQHEGSFSVDRNLNVFEVNWDPHDKDYTTNMNNDGFNNREPNYTSGKNITKVVRAISEPLLTSHFGNSIKIDEVFKRYGKHVSEHLSKKKTRYFNLVISLIKK
uniref:probable jasmonic acid carboxyl methyltransferase 2 n=1 Tax=Erigeron canadensis TaxID=72917 RepID=UPI001CB8DF82|nr:probable jasmonic acid carboxyl methyltransferase 2 [Erigeron canadensis]